MSTTTWKSGLRFGYASQNLTLPATTGRTMRLVNVPDADRMRSLVDANLCGLEAILRWNREHGMGLFRLSQQLIPFASHSQFPYDWQEEHGSELRRVGQLAANLGIRLSLHPGQFIQPGSPNGDTSARSIAELRYVARLLALLTPGMESSSFTWAARTATDPRRCTHFRGGIGIRIRNLAVPCPRERRTGVARSGGGQVASLLGVPVIVDALHHALNPGSLSAAGRAGPRAAHLEEPAESAPLQSRSGQTRGCPRLGDFTAGCGLAPGRAERSSSGRDGRGKRQGAGHSGAHDQRPQLRCSQTQGQVLFHRGLSRLASTLVGTSWERLRIAIA